MARLINACALVALFSSHVLAQWMGMGQQQTQPGMGPMGGIGQQARQLGFGGGWGQQPPMASSFGWGGLLRGGRQQSQQAPRYQTCIGRNGNSDEMKVTFILGSHVTDRWGAVGQAMGGFQPPTLRVNAEYRSPTSSLQGQFRLIVTEFSRVEDGCSSQALGEILNDRTFWGRSENPRGIIGNSVTIMPGQNVISSEVVENLSFQELTGQGLALCPANQIRSNQCLGIIPLCCKIGRDSQPATMPFVQRNQLFGQRSMFGQGQGMNNRFAVGGGRMNTGMGISSRAMIANSPTLSGISF